MPCMLLVSLSLVMFSWQGLASECGSVHDDFFENVGTKCQNKEVICPLSCKGEVATYRASCKGKTFKVTGLSNEEPEIRKYEEMPNFMVFFIAGAAGGVCQGALFDEAHGNVKTCWHAWDYFMALSTYFCGEQNDKTCGARCQKAIDTVHEKCRVGDVYGMQNGRKAVKIAENMDMSISMKQRTPKVCKYPEKTTAEPPKTDTSATTAAPRKTKYTTSATVGVQNCSDADKIINNGKEAFKKVMENSMSGVSVTDIKFVKLGCGRLLKEHNRRLTTQASVRADVTYVSATEVETPSPSSFPEALSKQLSKAGVSVSITGVEWTKPKDISTEVSAAVRASAAIFLLVLAGTVW